jgi:hypothetical protein
MRGRPASVESSIGPSAASVSGRLVGLLVVMLIAGSIRAGAQEQRTPAHADSGHVRPGRLLGVYDAVSGDPVADAVVTNVLNGLSARTTPTGTLSLFFVDTSGGMLRIQKVGYSPVTMVVANSERDTVPLTVLLSPAAHQLAAVVTRAHGKRGPADTVRSLEEHGFYERRLTSGAPSTAFVTAEKIEKLTVLSDVYSLTGRQVCIGNLYVNGVRLAPLTNPSLGKGRVLNTLTRNPIDQLFTPFDVEAIEMYRGSEVPTEYGGTSSSPSTCVTLIWTK